MAISYSELRDLAVIILALAFGFSYKFSGPATLSNWFGNFIVILALVGFSVVVHEVVHKAVAAKFLAEVKPQIWLSGVLVMLLLLVISRGWFVFAAIWAVSIMPLRLMRPGRTWPHLGPRERAIIGAAGPLANLGLALVAKLLTPVLGLLATKLMTINLTIAVFNLVPFFTLLPVLAAQKAKAKALAAPYIEGEFVLFGSRTGWVALFAFSLALAASLYFLAAAASLLLAAGLAMLLFVAWHYYFEPETLPGMETTTPSFRRYRQR